MPFVNCWTFCVMLLCNRTVFLFVCQLYVQTVRIGAEEEIDDTKGLKPEEINERIQEKEAKAHAQILEMVSSSSSLYTCQLTSFSISLL